MSRTIKGSKHFGYEYWGKRGNGMWGRPSYRGNNLQSDKRLTHRKERQMGKEVVAQEIKDYDQQE